MKIGTLIRDDYYGLGIIIGLYPDGQIVQFPSFNKIGYYDTEHTHLWEIVCK